MFLIFTFRAHPFSRQMLSVEIYGVRVKRFLAGCVKNRRKLAGSSSADPVLDILRCQACASGKMG